ncbi:MAG: NADH-quinone oxidoreductase subunit N [Bacteroidetes bacterium]|nr:NADH-quinone oxidoreductase subunit N [Bacteroidota bacterium]
MDALIVIFITGLVGLFVGMMKKPVLTLSISALGLVTAFILTLFSRSYVSIFSKYNGLSTSPLTDAFSLLAIGLTLLIVLGGFSYFKKDKEHTADYYGLMLFSLCGALILISFNNFFMFFLGLEIMSIPVYVLVGIKKSNVLSSEASIKYFFTGSFATGILLFGIALIYGATGTFDLATINSIRAIAEPSPMFHIGVLFMLAAFLFKVGAVPFHFWSPDVYQGSSDSVMAYMATVVKLAALCAFVKLFTYTFNQDEKIYTSVLLIVIVGSLFFGYLSALKQSNFKRMLAYSGISNTGLAMLTILTGDFGSLWVFLIGYTAATVTLMTLSQAIDKIDSEDIVNWKGIGYKNPFIGVVILISFLSLAGIPPLTGFFGKFLILSNAYQNHLALVILGLISSVIGASLYLRFIVLAFAKDSNAEKIVLTPLQHVVLSIGTLVVILGSSILIF